ncbi:MAG: hypothetical protein QXM12_02145, partial [Nitrososphaerota archaeon]
PLNFPETRGNIKNGTLKLAHDPFIKTRLTSLNHEIASYIKETSRFLEELDKPTTKSELTRTCKLDKINISPGNWIGSYL